MVRMAKKSKRPKLSEQVREAVEASGLSRYRIAKETGLYEATLSRFMSGERGLTLKALDVLAEYLGLEIVVRSPRRG